MNNSVFGKTMQNLRKRVDVRLVTNEKKLDKLTAKPTYMSSKIFNENLMAAHNHPLQRVFRMSQVPRASIWNSIHLKWEKNRRYRKSNFKPFQNHCWTKIFSFHGEYE